MKISMHKNEQGMGHILMIVMVVVVIAVIGAVGYEVMNRQNKPASTNNSATTSSTTNTTATTTSVYGTCLAQYHDSNICHFAQAQAAAPIDKTAYKATLASTQSGATGTLVFEQDGKGNSSTTISGGTGSISTVSFAGNYYTQSGGVWIKYPGTSSAATSAQSSSPSSDLSFMGSLTTTKFTKVDSEACGSLTCLKYQFTDSTMPNATNYVWIDTHDYLLREWSSTDGSGNSVDMKLAYQPVNISAPTPVEDFSAATQ